MLSDDPIKLYRADPPKLANLVCMSFASRDPEYWCEDSVEYRTDDYFYICSFCAHYWVASGVCEFDS